MTKDIKKVLIIAVIILAGLPGLISWIYYNKIYFYNSKNAIEFKDINKRMEYFENHFEELEELQKILMDNKEISQITHGTTKILDICTGSTIKLQYWTKMCIENRDKSKDYNKLDIAINIKKSKLYSVKTNYYTTGDKINFYLVDDSIFSIGYQYCIDGCVTEDIKIEEKDYYSEVHYIDENWSTFYVYDNIKL